MEDLRPLLFSPYGGGGYTPIISKVQALTVKKFRRLVSTGREQERRSLFLIGFLAGVGLHPGLEDVWTITFALLGFG